MRRVMKVARVLSREGNDEESVNIVIHACEYLTDTRIGRRWMIEVLLISFNLTSTWTRLGTPRRRRIITLIFVLTANSGSAFHKDDPHFPPFEEILSQENSFSLKVGVQGDEKLTNPVPIVDAAYNFRYILILHDLLCPVGCQVLCVNHF